MQGLHSYLPEKLEESLSEFCAAKHEYSQHNLKDEIEVRDKTCNRCVELVLGICAADLKSKVVRGKKAMPVCQMPSYRWL